MPIKITFHPDLHLIHSCPSESISAATAIRAWRAHFDTHPLTPGTDIVIDHRQVRDYQIDFMQMQRIASVLIGVMARQSPAGRIAHLAPSELGFGMARMFELVSTSQPSADMPVDIQVFTEPEAVDVWLGHPPGTLAALA